MRVAVVFWSGGGNTEAMANAVADGAREAGAEVSLLNCADFDGGVDDYDALGFGCPAMGTEGLEEDEFDQMFTAVENKLAGKKVALFGSYGWGGGGWMRSWEERCLSDGITLAAESVICMKEPDHDALEQCKALGAELAK